MVVYILFSDKRSRYYVGQTANIDDRLERHNQGRVKSTKQGMPWKLVWQFLVKGRSEALKLEQKIKKRGAKRFLEDLEKKRLKFLN
ncbi:MAG TPA: GIY-YIG nuclease family protein [Salegentibacter sp.]|nr:GIY-YIG nuclease family protein [Salegentibacter sp.]